MKTIFTKRLISTTAVVTSAVLGLVVSNSAYAATSAKVAPPPPKLVAPVIRAPIALNMAQLNQRVAVVPALASAQAGDRIILSDDGSVTDAIWQGNYVFYPAGSKVPPGAMYLRWKDGLVAITPTPASTAGQPLPGTLDASFVAQKFDINGNPTLNYQTIQTLVTDSSNSSVLRIPGNAWLFRVDSNGQYTTLVDAFVFQSGTQPVLDQPDANGTLPAATGSQPVPVSASALAG